jgi:hypothetical protein
MVFGFVFGFWVKPGRIGQGLTEEQAAWAVWESFMIKLGLPIEHNWKRTPGKNEEISGHGREVCSGRAESL